MSSLYHVCDDGLDEELKQARIETLVKDLPPQVLDCPKRDYIFSRIFEIQISRRHESTSISLLMPPETVEWARELGHGLQLHDVEFELFVWNNKLYLFFFSDSVGKKPNFEHFDKGIVILPGQNYEMEIMVNSKGMCVLSRSRHGLDSYQVTEFYDNKTYTHVLGTSDLVNFKDCFNHRLHLFVRNRPNLEISTQADSYDFENRNNSILWNFIIGNTRVFDFNKKIGRFSPIA